MAIPFFLCLNASVSSVLETFLIFFSRWSINNTDTVIKNVNGIYDFSVRYTFSPFSLIKVLVKGSI